MLFDRHVPWVRNTRCTLCRGLTVSLPGHWPFDQWSERNEAKCIYQWTSGLQLHALFHEQTAEWPKCSYPALQPCLSCIEPAPNIICLVRVQTFSVNQYLLSSRWGTAKLAATVWTRALRTTTRPSSTPATACPPRSDQTHAQFVCTWFQCMWSSV